MLLSTTDVSTTKWDNIVYSRHGGSNHQAWWYKNRNNKLTFHTPDGKLNYIDVNKMKLAVYVKVVSQDMYKLRNNYLFYMDDPKAYFCKDRQLPLIASSKLDNKFTYYYLPTDIICRKNNIRVALN